MTCLEAREALVVADLRDLATTNSELAAHLRECTDCGARANAITAQTASLASAVRLRARRRRSRRLLLAAAAPIAAALVLAIALQSRRERVVPEVRSSSLPVARSVSVTVAQGQSAAVLRTADTTVTVVWFTGAGQ
jgi:hypothetical protein